MGEAVDPVRHVHDDAHVVLDDEQGDPELGVGALQAVDQAVDQGGVDAGRGLVEQQHGRLVHQRHRELEQLLLPERQRAGSEQALFVQADVIEQALGAFDVLAGVAPERIEEAHLAMRQGHQHVLDAVHRAVDARLLERAQQAETRDLLHLHLRYFGPLVADRAGIDRVVADDGIEQRRLAGAVRPDQAGDGATRDRHRNVAVGDDAAERLGDALDLDDAAHGAAPARASPPASLRSTRMPNHSGFLYVSQPITPSWKYTTVTTIRAPSATHCQPSR